MYQQFSYIIRKIIEKIRSCILQGGKPIEVLGLFDVSVLNGLWTMLAGHRFALNDVKLAKLMDLVHVSFRMLDMSGGILNQMPFIRFLAPKCSGYKDIKNILTEFYTFLKVNLNLFELLFYSLTNV